MLGRSAKIRRKTGDLHLPFLLGCCARERARKALGMSDDYDYDDQDDFYPHDCADEEWSEGFECDECGSRWGRNLGYMILCRRCAIEDFDNAPLGYADHTEDFHSDDGL